MKSKLTKVALEATARAVEDKGPRGKHHYLAYSSVEEGCYEDHSRCVVGTSVFGHGAKIVPVSIVYSDG